MFSHNDFLIFPSSLSTGGKSRNQDQTQLYHFLNIHLISDRSLSSHTPQFPHPSDERIFQYSCFMTDSERWREPPANPPPSNSSFAFICVTNNTSFYKIFGKRIWSHFLKVWKSLNWMFRTASPAQEQVPHVWDGDNNIDPLHIYEVDQGTHAEQSTEQRKHRCVSYYCPQLHIAPSQVRLCFVALKLWV